MRQETKLNYIRWGIRLLNGTSRNVKWDEGKKIPGSGERAMFKK